MLNPEDRAAIEGLFNRLEDVARRTPDRDAEAETLISREMVRQPGAPYYMAQTILVQQHALEVADRRIRELEEAAERGRGGFFGGLFDDGRGRQNRNEERQVQPQQQRSRGPWDGEQRGQGGGGFLAGAAQTALGVAGGVMLGSAIGSMFGAGAAQASEAPSEPDQSGNDTDPGNDDFGSSDFGGGDGGGFDMGGDF